jgi:hypothetical protein
MTLLVEDISIHRQNEHQDGEVDNIETTEISLTESSTHKTE